MRLAMLGPTSYVAATARVVVGAALIVAALTKMMSINAFSSVLLDFPIAKRLRTPKRARLAARTLVSLELVLGSLFLAGLFIRAVQVLVVGLFLSFSAGLVFVLVTHERTSCGCFGDVSSKSVTWTSVTRNAGLIGLAVVGGWRIELSVDGILAAAAPARSVVLLCTDALLATLTIVVWTSYAKLRRNPNYVYHVPSAPGPQQSDVWEGSREV